jgi:hypothetical protein
MLVKKSINKTEKKIPHHFGNKLALAGQYALSGSPAIP